MTDDEIRALRLDVADLTRHDGPFDEVEELCDEALKDRASLATARALLKRAGEHMGGTWRAHDAQEPREIVCTCEWCECFRNIAAFLHPTPS